MFGMCHIHKNNLYQKKKKKWLHIIYWEQEHTKTDTSQTKQTTWGWKSVILYNAFLNVNNDRAKQIKIIDIMEPILQPHLGVEPR